MIEALPEEQWRQARQAFGAAPSVGVLIHVHRGQPRGSRTDQSTLFDELATSADLQERAVHTCGTEPACSSPKEGPQRLSC